MAVKLNPYVRTFLTSLLAIFIVVGIANTILIGSLFSVSFNKGFYYSEFEKYSVYNNFAYGKDKVDSEFSDVIDFVQGKDVVLDSSFYNEKERQHLEDVREIFSFTRTVLIASMFAVIIGIVSLFFFRERIEILTAMFLGGCLSAGIIIVTAILSLLNFNSAFIFFHKILFTNDLWLLDFRTDNLIRMMPQQIFSDIALRWGAIALIVSAAFIVAAIYMRRRELKRETRNKSKKTQ